MFFVSQPIDRVFCLFFFVLHLLQRVTRCHWIVASGVFGVVGWANEFLIVGRIMQMGGILLVVMSVLCVLIYAVMAILPSYYSRQALCNRRSLDANPRE